MTEPEHCHHPAARAYDGQLFCDYCDTHLGPDDDSVYRSEWPEETAARIAYENNGIPDEQPDECTEPREADDVPN